MYVACISFKKKEVKPHYLGALLVILAPHQGSIILWKTREKNIRVVVENAFLIIHQSIRSFDHPVTFFNSTVEQWNCGQMSHTLSQLCLPSACNLSRKVGSAAPGPGQTSGQLQPSTVTSGPCLISRQTSPKSPRWELMSAVLARVQILPISSDCCGSATFCALTRQTFGLNSPVAACKYESWQARDQWG